jgi:hypothetical protein
VVTDEVERIIELVLLGRGRHRARTNLRSSAVSRKAVPTRLGKRALDFRGRDRNPVFWLKHLSGVDWHPVDSDQVRARIARLNRSFNQVGDGRAILDLDVVAVSAAIVVDQKYAHEVVSLAVRRSGNRCITTQLFLADDAFLCGRVDEFGRDA